MVLVDTSVWIDHLRTGNPVLAGLLNRAQVLTHPFVVGELACGNLKDRRNILQLLGELPMSPVATDREVLAYIEQRNLMGRGVGYIDVHLLASATLADASRLWSKDKRLAGIASELGLEYQGEG